MKAIYYVSDNLTIETLSIEDANEMCDRQGLLEHSHIVNNLDYFHSKYLAANKLKRLIRERVFQLHVRIRAINRDLKDNKGRELPII